MIRCVPTPRPEASHEFVNGIRVFIISVNPVRINLHLSTISSMFQCHTISQFLIKEPVKALLGIGCGLFSSPITAIVFSLRKCVQKTAMHALALSCSLQKGLYQWLLLIPSEKNLLTA